jgi:hypothetical protein
LLPCFSAGFITDLEALAGCVRIAFFGICSTSFNDGFAGESFLFYVELE